MTNIKGNAYSKVENPGANGIACSSDENSEAEGIACSRVENPGADPADLKVRSPD